MLLLSTSHLSVRCQLLTQSNSKPTFPLEEGLLDCGEKKVKARIMKQQIKKHHPKGL